MEVVMREYWGGQWRGGMLIAIVIPALVLLGLLARPEAWDWRWMGLAGVVFGIGVGSARYARGRYEWWVEAERRWGEGVAPKTAGSGAEDGGEGNAEDTEETRRGAEGGGG
jgi:hypothetical protein